MDTDRMDNTDRIDDLSESDLGRPARVGGLRASDADRVATADLLRQQYATGRLDAREFEERVGRCYAAMTVDELHELVVDLPPDEAGEVALNRVRAPRNPIGRLAMVAPLVVVLVAVSGLTGAHLVWLAWPLAFFVLRAGLWQGWRGA